MEPKNSLTITLSFFNELFCLINKNNLSLKVLSSENLEENSDNLNRCNNYAHAIDTFYLVKTSLELRALQIFIFCR